MKTLRQLIDNYGSDKNVNQYTPIYHSIFNPLRNNDINLLEIGIGTMVPNAPSSMVGYGIGDYKPGASLKAFRDFFPNGKIYGGDVQEDCMFEEERIKTFLFNSTKLEECNIALGDLQFDIIIDDGLHEVNAQLNTFNNLFYRLKSGGYYFIEDIAYHNPLYEKWEDIFAEIHCEKWTSRHRNIIVFLKH
mgnify:CR=1 FL=1|tara:strand:- start:1472 stop:2041 length:570 start_codon:yes stop_codon:yes gene_type:complete